MLDQDSSFYMISLNILITFLLNNVWYYREKFHVDHFCELKSSRFSKSGIFTFGPWSRSEGSSRVLQEYLRVSILGMIVVV